jgi:hypothetical protein
MNATHMVLKPFTGPDDYQFKSGEKVDAREWRTVDRLVAHRYLRPLPPDESRQMVEPSRSRRIKGDMTDGD